MSAAALRRGAKASKSDGEPERDEVHPQRQSTHSAGSHPSGKRIRPMLKAKKSVKTTNTPTTCRRRAVLNSHHEPANRHHRREHDAPMAEL